MAPWSAARHWKFAHSLILLKTRFDDSGVTHANLKNLWPYLLRF
jgi:hypothetical protein